MKGEIHEPPAPRFHRRSRLHFPHGDLRNIPPSQTSSLARRKAGASLATGKTRRASHRSALERAQGADLFKRQVPKLQRNSDKGGTSLRLSFEKRAGDLQDLF